jgi:HupE / UreJ protein
VIANVLLDWRIFAACIQIVGQVDNPVDNLRPIGNRPARDANAGLVAARLLLLLLIPAPLAAHMVSMSTGDLRVTGAAAHYELRMPLYEVAHVRDPERTFFDHIHFRGGGGEARLGKHACSEQEGVYVCAADYQFPAPPDAVTIECTLASVTVPNHVHLLRAYKDDKSDQAVFDLSFTSAEVRFRPPTAFEMAVKETAAGSLRAVEGAAPLLFLAALVLAARTRRELVALAGALLGGELAAILLALALRIQPSPRFIEAAAALTIAYLALEVVLLPHSRTRWVVVAVLGLFHGMYFAAFLSASGYGPAAFFAGVATAQVLVIGGLGLASRPILAIRRVVPVAASLLLVAGLGWFFLRLWR